jgi:NADH dehydrogenase FAD-containing subunit
MRLLQALNVQVHASARVSAVLANGVKLADGRFIAAELVVWAAGVKAPDVLKQLAGLETNRINQLIVAPTLETTRDANIFAIGDCASCPWPGHDQPVPPRAQAAHQQASHMLGQIRRRLAGEPLRDYRYRDFGSLVSLGEYSTVGNLMGGLVGGNLFVEGYFARMIQGALRHASAGASRAHEGRAGHARATDYAAHRAACEAPLAVLQIATFVPSRRTLGRFSRSGLALGRKLNFRLTLVEANEAVDVGIRAEVVQGDLEDLAHEIAHRHR